MREVVIPLVMAVIGVRAIIWALAIARALTGARVTGSIEEAEGAQDAEVVGIIRGPAVGYSPLQGLPCVHWDVRVTRIIERVPAARQSRLETIVDVEQSPPGPFTIDTDGGQVAVDASHSRVSSGHVTVHRDQAAVERSLDVAGLTHVLPPAAHGTRQIAEAALQPGQRIWVTGQVHRTPEGPWLRGTPDRPLRIDAIPHQQRRLHLRMLAIGAGLLGVVLVLGAAALVW